MGVRSLGDQSLNSELSKVWISSQEKESVLTCPLASGPYAKTPSVLKNVHGFL